MVRKKERDKQKKKRANVREIAEKQTAGFQPTCFTLPQGTTMFSIRDAKIKRVDILEYEVGEGNPFVTAGLLWYDRTYYRHRDVGINRRTYTCPLETANQRCPICEYRAKLQRAGDADPELIKSLRVQRRQLFNVFDQAEPDKGVQIWEYSFFQFGELLATELRDADEEDELDSFASVDEDGKSLKLSVQENPPYGFEVKSIKFQPRRVALSEELIESVHCLDDLIVVPEYDDLKKLFLQAEEPEAEENEEEEEPPKRKPRNKPKQPKVEKEPDVPDDADVGGSGDGGDPGTVDDDDDGFWDDE